MKSFFSKGDRFLGFFRYIRNKHGEFVLRPVWGRLCSLLCVLTLTGWLSAAFAVFLFAKYQRDFQGGHYLHIVFPWKWDEYQTAWGDEFIERGKAALEEGDAREGIHMIRVGHTKSPNNLEGRLLMADLYMAVWNRPDRAARVLREGLPLGGLEDVDYLRTTVRTLLANQEDYAVIEIVEELLGDEPELTVINQTAALAAATASFHRGAYDEAERYLTSYQLEENREARLLLARVEWERGEREAAIARLERQARRFSEQDEIYALLSRYHREMGDLEKAHRYAVMRQINDPMSHGPRLAMLYIRHAEENEQAVERGTERLLRDFADNYRAMIGLGEFAAFSKNPELAREVFHAMDRAGHALEVAAVLVTESYLEAGRYREGIRFMEDQMESLDRLEEAYRPLLDGLYSVAYFGLGDDDNAEMHLGRFVSARNLRTENLLSVSRRIQDLGHLDVARSLLQQAHNADERNQAVLTELVTLDLRTGRAEDLAENIEKLLTTRKPSRELLEESLARLSRDRFLFMESRHELLESLKEQIPARSAPLSTHS